MLGTIHELVQLFFAKKNFSRRADSSGFGDWVAALLVLGFLEPCQAAACRRATLAAIGTGVRPV
jgi:hypothetical protein